MNVKRRAFMILPVLPLIQSLNVEDNPLGFSGTVYEDATTGMVDSANIIIGDDHLRCPVHGTKILPFQFASTDLPPVCSQCFAEWVARNVPALEKE